MIAPFIPTFDQLRPFAGGLWLIATIVAVLLAPFFTRRANLVCGIVALTGVLLALISTLIIGAGPDIVGDYFHGLLVYDRVSYLWQIILLLFVFGVILMWFTTTLHTLHEGDGPEFFTLLLGATLGMCLMAETSNLLMIFMAVELASLPSYVLAGFRKTHRVGAEASLKYVLFGAACSSILVYGLSFVYGLYGTLQIADLTIASAHGQTALVIATERNHLSVSPSPGTPGEGRGEGDLDDRTALVRPNHPHPNPLPAYRERGPERAKPNDLVLVIVMIGLLAGIGFKIAAVPFHFWCPDVFEGAAIDVTTFLSVASKGAGLILLLRVMETIAGASHFTGTNMLTALAVVIGIMGAISATVGNTGAFAQTNIKRLLAYSSIAHAGYMLCAVSLLVKGKAADGAFVPAAAAAQAILLYLAVYAVMNLGAFMVTAMVGETLADFRGLSRRSPLLAGCMFCCMVSLIGLPPFAGFGAKLQLLWALFQNGGWTWALIVVIAINTIISAFYYFRVIRAMYLEPGPQPVIRPNPLGLAISLICVAALIVLFLGFGPLSKITGSFGHLHQQIISQE